MITIDRKMCPVNKQDKKSNIILSNKIGCLHIITEDNILFIIGLKDMLYVFHRPIH